MRNTCCLSAGSTLALADDIFLCVHLDFAFCGFSPGAIPMYEGSIMKLMDATDRNEIIMRIAQRRKHLSLMLIDAMASLSEDVLS